jgi:hypothetical protein
VIVISSRDFVAILLLYRCLRQFHTEHELRTIFSSSQFSQKRSKLSDCAFWKFFYKRKILFLIHLLYAKSTFSDDRELYKKKWCDQMRTWFSSHWKTDSLFNSHESLSRKKTKKRTKSVNRLSQIVVARFVAERVVIRSLKRRETEQICFWLMILSNHQLSFDR